MVETDKPQGYNEVTHAAASKPPDPFRESLIASESAKVWGTSKTQENQGVVHFYDYQTTQAKRLKTIEKRLGIEPGTFSNTVDGFDRFTSEAKNIIKQGKCRQIDEKKIYYIGADISADVEGSGVMVITWKDRLQTMMPASYKSFMTRQ